MRCPECSQRNSVASRKCEACGHKFPRKPMSMGVKIGAVAIAGGLLVWGAGAAFIPKYTDPENTLARVAKQMAEGPKNPDDALKIRGEFEKALRKYLAGIGDQPNRDIVKKLQKVLPEAAYEIHVGDLPRGLKVVEIDSVLQASEFLVMKSASGTKVFPLSGMEVFDDARLINQNVGPMLVMLGHSGGQPPHRPQVRVYALLPDDIVDETKKFLPPQQGDGTARFAANGRDIVLDLSLLSLGQAEKLFSADNQVEDGTVRQYLDWKDARYSSRYEYGTSPFIAAYALARCLRHPELTAAHAQILGRSGQALVSAHKSPTAGQFQIRRLAGGGDKVSYSLRGNGGNFKVTAAKSGSQWAIANADTLKAGEKVTLAEQLPPVVSAKPAMPVVEPVKVAEVKQPVVVAKAPVRPLKPEDKVVIRTLGSTKLQPVKTVKVEPVVAVKPQPVPLKPQPKAPSKPPEPVKVAKATKPPIVEKSTVKAIAPKVVERIVPAQISRQISSDRVKVRSAPNTDSRAVAELPKGSSLEVVGKQQGWYKVRYQGKDGFVYGGLVDYKKSDAYTTAVMTKAKVITDKHKKTLSSPQVGDRLVILGGIRNDKYPVQLANGKVGYVDKDAVDVAIDAPPQVP